MMKMSPLILSDQAIYFLDMYLSLNFPYFVFSAQEYRIFHLLGGEKKDLSYTLRLLRIKLANSAFELSPAKT